LRMGILSDPTGVVSQNGPMASRQREEETRIK
jgi:hypothetical protein